MRATRSGGTAATQRQDRRPRLLRLVPERDEHVLRANGTPAQYGIFSSNWTGGTWSRTYASNFSDSGYYIGACHQRCDQTIDRAHAEFNALGYSGTNSGGPLVIKNSEFNNNQDGFDTDSENSDPPPPQNGACPTTASARSPTPTHAGC